jgi:hypothetical protein
MLAARKIAAETLPSVRQTKVTRKSPQEVHAAALSRRRSDPSGSKNSVRSLRFSEDGDGGERLERFDKFGNPIEDGGRHKISFVDDARVNPEKNRFKRAASLLEVHVVPEVKTRYKFTRKGVCCLRWWSAEEYLDDGHSDSEDSPKHQAEEPSDPHSGGPGGAGARSPRGGAAARGRERGGGGAGSREEERQQSAARSTNNSSGPQQERAAEQSAAI